MKQTFAYLLRPVQWFFLKKSLQVWRLYRCKDLHRRRVDSQTLVDSPIFHSENGNYSLLFLVDWKAAVKPLFCSFKTKHYHFPFWLEFGCTTEKLEKQEVLSEHDFTRTPLYLKIEESSSDVWFMTRFSGEYCSTLLIVDSFNPLVMQINLIQSHKATLMIETAWVMSISDWKCKMMLS